MDIITDATYSRTTNPDMALGTSSSPDVPVSPEAAQVRRISMALVAANLSDTNMVTDDYSD